MVEPIIVSCSCGRRFQAKPELAGKRLSCPACGCPISIPLAGTEPLHTSAPAADDDPLGFGPLASSSGIPSVGGRLLTTPGTGRGNYRTTSRRGWPTAKTALWIAFGVGGGLLALLFLVVTLRVVVGITKGHAPLPETPAQTKETQGPQMFENPLDGYRVELPGPPVRKMQTLRTPSGSKNISETRFERGNVDRGNGERFWVCRHPFNLPPLRIGQTLDVDALLEVGFEGSKTTFRRNFHFHGHPARETTFEGSRAGHTYVSRARVIVTGNAIYEVQWLASPAKPESEEVRRLFDTFEFTTPQMPLPEHAIR